MSHLIVHNLFISGKELRPSGSPGRGDLSDYPVGVAEDFDLTPLRLPPPTVGSLARKRESGLPMTRDLNRRYRKCVRPCVWS
jgi:hypothetical protein